jgi:hypothetical protein
MSMIDKKKLVVLMREVYRQRLNEALNEMDIFDSRGTMVLGKDTKVRHKDTGYEYTVADVKVDPEGSDTKVILRLPDEPRVEPADSDEVISDDKQKDHFLGELDELDVQVGEDDHDVVFVVDKKEFEDEYEVQ